MIWPGVRLALLLATAVAVFMRPLAAQDGPLPKLPTPEKATRPEEATLGKGSSPQDVIALKAGHLTLLAENLSLEWILEEISRLARIAIVRAPGLESDGITQRIENLPLEQALRQILENHDAFFFYGVNTTAPAGLRVVWVYPRGQGRGMAPIPPSSWASTKELINEASTRADPAGRAQAVEALVERLGDQASTVLRDALQDAEDEVRMRALHGALNAGVAVPADALAQLAISDPSARVRFLALEGLRVDPSSSYVRPVAEQALRDPDPQVRKKAEEILVGLKPVQRLAPRMPQQQSPRSR